MKRLIKGQLVIWVYKENIKAISLYKKLGFEVVEETQTRYYMIHTN